MTEIVGNPEVAVRKLETEKFCTNCGQAIHAKAEICPKGGVRQVTMYRDHKNKVVADLLAIFLGGFGIHKFYLNRPGQGILYLVFFWTIIPAIIAFFEGIIYLCTNDAQFAEKYG